MEAYQFEVAYFCLRYLVVIITPDVKIYTATHSVQLAERMPERTHPGASICDTIARPVLIENGVWIGGGSTILPGVTIGKNSVIGAGSVVVKDIPANSIAVGNPCRVIKNIGSCKSPFATLT